MNKPLRIALPILIIAVAVIIARAMIAGRETPQRQSPPTPAPLVQVIELQPVNHQITIHSQGVVQARTEGDVLTQVAGDVVEVGADFRDGGFIEPGDLLLKIDPRDYRTAVTIARAELSQARLQLAEEQARSAQAKRDLDRLQLEGKPSDLALRKPQLAGARAAVSAAEARLAQAELNLQRTEIRAPYAGRVIEQRADIGQYVTPGAVLGRIYAIDYVEVRLPLTNDQLAQIDLPQSYRGNATAAEVEQPLVVLSANVAGTVHRYQGRIVRSDGAIDANSRQTFVIAQVDDPYAPRDDGRPPLMVGQYITADIAGRELANVFVLPRAALNTDGLAFHVTPENTLQALQPKIVWRGDQNLIVSEGIPASARVVITPLALPTDGMPVRVSGND